MNRDFVRYCEVCYHHEKHRSEVIHEAVKINVTFPDGHWIAQRACALLAMTHRRQLKKCRLD